MSHSDLQKRIRIRCTAGQLVAAATLGLSLGAAKAGPCTRDIAQFEATVRDTAGDPSAGLTARQTVGAQLDHQPTPQSIRRADQRLKSRFATAIARAKRFDVEGNRAGCRRALNAAKKLYIP